jgi:regulator of replication initiation timing
MNDILQQLENKVVALVDEIEKLRATNRQLATENHEIKGGSQHDEEKLRGILSLLEDVNTTEAVPV